MPITESSQDNEGLFKQYLVEANDFYSNKEYGNAIRSYASALELRIISPHINYDSIQLAIANCYIGLENYPVAYAMFRSLYPRYSGTKSFEVAYAKCKNELKKLALAHQADAQEFYDHGNLDAAVGELEIAISFAPQDDDTIIKTLQTFKKQIEWCQLSPGVDSRLLKGLELIKHERLDEAIILLSHSFEDYKCNFDFLNEDEKERLKVASSTLSQIKNKIKKDADRNVQVKINNLLPQLRLSLKRFDAISASNILVEICNLCLEIDSDNISDLNYIPLEVIIASQAELCTWSKDFSLRAFKFSKINATLIATLVRDQKEISENDYTCIKAKAESYFRENWLKFDDVNLLSFNRDLAEDIADSLSSRLPLLSCFGCPCGYYIRDEEALACLILDRMHLFNRLSAHPPIELQILEYIEVHPRVAVIHRYSPIPMAQEVNTIPLEDAMKNEEPPARTILSVLLNQ